MPLRDHFRPPFSHISSWEEVHGGWPMVIVQQLGKILPAQYVAGPRVHLGAQAEVDIASFEQLGSSSRSGSDAAYAGGTAVATWSPASPTLVMRSEEHTSELQSL